MKKQTEIKIVEVQVDGEGEEFIILPPKMLEKLGWDENTELNVALDAENKRVVLTKHV